MPPSGFRKVLTAKEKLTVPRVGDRLYPIIAVKVFPLEFNSLYSRASHEPTNLVHAPAAASMEIISGV